MIENRSKIWIFFIIGFLIFPPVFYVIDLTKIYKKSLFFDSFFLAGLFGLTLGSFFLLKIITNNDLPYIFRRFRYIFLDSSTNILDELEIYLKQNDFTQCENRFDLPYSNEFSVINYIKDYTVEMNNRYGWSYIFFIRILIKKNAFNKVAIEAAIFPQNEKNLKKLIFLNFDDDPKSAIFLKNLVEELNLRKYQRDVVWFKAD